MEGKLPFDPIDEAARQWAKRWDGVPQMHAVTSLMRVQQLVLGRLDALLRPHGLTFARYEALVLLCFSSAGSLPLGKMGERLQVHPTSITSIIDRLESAGLVVRRPHPDDGRAVLAEITDAGRAVVEAATADLVGADFGLGDARRRAAGGALRPAASGAAGGRRLLTLVEFSWTSYYLRYDRDTARERWQAGYDAALDKGRVRDADFTTLSGLEVEPGVRPTDGSGEWPGEFPFTRGLYATGHRGRTWTIRQFAGFGNAAADQRALQDDPQPRRRRAVGRVRHADPDGPRLRRPEERSARSGTAVSRSTRPPTWRSSSAASRSGTSPRR